MSKLVSIYQRKGSLFVSACHKTDAGFWLADTETEVVDHNDEQGLEKAIINALARSREGVPTPVRDTNRIAPLLDAAKVSSWSTFIKLAKSVDVYLKDETFEITPYRNLGGSDGFDPMTEKIVRLDEKTSDLGSSVLAALTVAE